MPAEPLSAIRHPRETERLLGHAAAKDAILAALASGRLPHAWMIGGAPGIGKATFAYQVARFLVTGDDERTGEGLEVRPGGRTFRQVAAAAHPNVMVLERLASGEKGTARTIPVEQVRKALAFFATTAADGGARVLIVDSLEDLNVHGANALLKTIEEPPSRATILLVSHAPHRVLPTIRSRCRKLALAPLATGDVAGVLAGLGIDGEGAERAAALADGSVGRALDLLAPRRFALVEAVDAAIAALPHVPVATILRLADLMAERSGEDFALGLDRLLRRLTAVASDAAALGGARLAPLADACEKIEADALVLEAYNLDRRAFVIGLFAMLEAAWRQGELPRVA